MNDKKTIFSGIQPSGTLTLGNYLGALKNWADLQKDDDLFCLYCVVDMHAITVRQERKDFSNQTLSTYALFLACGIDVNKSIVFLQSHVSAHAELGWILSCHTQFGELSRMTQFKDKSRSHADNINAGLFTYPALMAADILLYDTYGVPVGEDQRQHLELTRNVAIRMNGIYGDLFKVPEAFIPKVGAKIMSLSEPTKKMSKSDENENGYIALLDKPEIIMKKFKRAVTDSGSGIRFDEQNKPGISNLMSIYAASTGKTMGEIEKEFENSLYGAFKEAVGEAVCESLRPIQKRYDEFMADKGELLRLQWAHAERAGEIADRTMRRVRKKMGFIEKDSKRQE